MRMTGRRSAVWVLAIAATMLVATAASAATINVNMYASNGGNQNPENAATLAGPAGGLGESWNQFNTTSGSSLLDSTGAATTVGFTNNVGSGWAWGSPSLPMLKAGRAHFTKGQDTAHTITGLAPRALYDVWVASYAHNSTAGERALGEWATSNTTTTAGAQMIDSRTGLNGTTWEYGRNYVKFEDVEANATGQIVLLGDAADVGDYGETYATRLPLSGFQVEQTAAAPPSRVYMNVNMYANSGGDQNPEDPAALVGPAGGFGETWNQFNTTSGSALLDATGAATGVGFNNNVGSGWVWNQAGTVDLKMIRGGRAHFGKGADTTHTITGLTPGDVFDLYVASYAHNAWSQEERALGEWSITNATSTVGAQMIDSRAGLNASTWEEGLNYVLFEDVVVDANGEITLLGDAADVGDYGEQFATRLPLSGFQLVRPDGEIPEPATLALLGLAACGLGRYVRRRRKA